MSVVINDFEVIVEPPEAPEAEAVEGVPESSPSLSPMDIRNIDEHYEERQARLRAH